MSSIAREINGYISSGDEFVLDTNKIVRLVKNPDGRKVLKKLESALNCVLFPIVVTELQGELQGGDVFKDRREVSALEHFLKVMSGRETLKKETPPEVINEFTKKLYHILPCLPRVICHSVLLSTDENSFVSRVQAHLAELGDRPELVSPQQLDSVRDEMRELFADAVDTVHESADQLIDTYKINRDMLDDANYEGSLDKMAKGTVMDIKRAFQASHLSSSIFAQLVKDLRNKPYAPDINLVANSMAKGIVPASDDNDVQMLLVLHAAAGFED